MAAFDEVWTLMNNKKNFFPVGYEEHTKSKRKWSGHFGIFFKESYCNSFGLSLMVFLSSSPRPPATSCSLFCLNFTSSKGCPERNINVTSLCPSPYVVPSNRTLLFPTLSSVFLFEVQYIWYIILFELVTHRVEEDDGYSNVEPKRREESTSTHWRSSLLITILWPG